MIDLESVVTCPVCGNHQLVHFVHTTDFTATREDFNIVKCSSCQLGITTPRPAPQAIARYYESPQYISHTGGTGSIGDRLYRTVRNYSIGNKLELLATHHSVGSLLDYGCGTGEFLARARFTGWDCTGVEPSPEARKKVTPGIPVHHDLAAAKGKFDVITLWHVLEHLHELNPTLQALRDRLTPGGIIFIAVPNYESFDAATYGKYWAGYDVPRHLWHFTKGSLTQLLAKHKLNILAIEPMKFDAFYVSMLSESYRKGGRTLLTMTSALMTGLRSNAAAGSDNYSSLIYIARS